MNNQKENLKIEREIFGIQKKKCYKKDYSTKKEHLYIKMVLNLFPYKIDEKENQLINEKN